MNNKFIRFFVTGAAKRNILRRAKSWIYLLFAICYLLFMVSATIGIYDGVHAGHRKILKKLISLRGRRIVFLFPKNPRKGEKIVSSFRERKNILKSMGLSVTRLEIEKFWKMSARAFFDNVITEKYGVRHLVVGDDFVFGHGKRGTIKRLKAWAQAKQVKITVVSAKKINGKKISSTLIKKLLAAGRVAEAAGLLGRPYSVTGEKIKGRGISRSLGFPTVNLKIAGDKIIPEGVFAVKVARSEEHTSELQSH